MELLMVIYQGLVMVKFLRPLLGTSEHIKEGTKCGVLFGYLDGILLGAKPGTCDGIILGDGISLEHH